MPKKRPLDNFFTPASTKKARVLHDPAPTPSEEQLGRQLSNHSTYPFPIPSLPAPVSDRLSEVPAAEGKEIKDQPHLDLVYFEPYIPRSIERQLFEFLRKGLFYYRVKYKIKRGPVETEINTPR